MLQHDKLCKLPVAQLMRLTKVIALRKDNGLLCRRSLLHSATAALSAEATSR